MDSNSIELQTEAGKRRLITNGGSWKRFLLLPVFFFLFLFISNYPQNWIGYTLLLLSIGVFYVLKKLKKLMHDDEYLYIIKGENEKRIHYKDIQSIKKSATKVNGERFWKLEYTDEHSKKQTIRFFANFNDEFHNSVHKVNSNVVIWNHPFLGH